MKTIFGLKDIFQLFDERNVAFRNFHYPALLPVLLKFNSFGINLILIIIY